MMVKLVPWFSWEEWDQIYYYLYHSSTEMNKMGIERVICWRSRGQLPISVETTAILVEARCLDWERPENISEFMVRVTYSLAIIRFINTLADTRQKGVLAKT